MIFDGATVVIDAATTALESGSTFEFVNSTAAIVPTAVNTITFNSGNSLIAGSSAHLALGVFGLPGGVLDGHIKVDGGILTIMGGTTAKSLEILHGGEVTIAGGKVSFSGTVPGSSTTSVDVYGGILNIQGGSTLDGGSKDIHVSGWDGSPAYAGELNTLSGVNSDEAKITSNKLFIGFSAGDVTVTIGKGPVFPGNHIYGVLNVQAPVEWHRGKYRPTVHGTQQGTRDRWITTGMGNTFKIKGSATSVEPISAPGVSGTTPTPYWNPRHYSPSCPTTMAPSRAFHW